MKTFIKFALLSALLMTGYGCASGKGTYETRLNPPDEFNLVFQKYKELPGQKVMVVAVDPTGEWAFGFDDGRATLKEAAIAAAAKCDKSRFDFRVYTKAKLFAVNNKVVYHDNLKKTSKKKSR